MAENDRRLLSMSRFLLFLLHFVGQTLHPAIHEGSVRILFVWKPSVQAPHVLVHGEARVRPGRRQVRPAAIAAPAVEHSLVFAVALCGSLAPLLLKLGVGLLMLLVLRGGGTGPPAKHLVFRRKERRGGWNWFAVWGVGLPDLVRLFWHIAVVVRGVERLKLLLDGLPLLWVLVKAYHMTTHGNTEVLVDLAEYWPLELAVLMRLAPEQILALNEREKQLSR